MKVVIYLCFALVYLVFFLITQQRVTDNMFHLLLSGFGHWFCTIFVSSLPGNRVLESRFDTYCLEIMRETCCLLEIPWSLVNITFFRPRAFLCFVFR